MNENRTAELRPELEPLPALMAHLPVHRGYPVPWFVEWVEGAGDEMTQCPIGTGSPEFRIMSHERYERAVGEDRCWVCGGRMSSYRAFVIGPMCAVNLTSAEPPSHVECGEWSARNCPFLSRPHMSRRENGLPDSLVVAGGHAIKRNPGCSGVWVVHRSQPRMFRDGRGGQLFNIGYPPERVSWWAEGRAATREEVEFSIETGEPFLREQCDGEPTERLRREAHEELDQYLERVVGWLPGAVAA